MQLLLGLFFFSILLATGNSLQCVTCLALNGYCSDVVEECPPKADICQSLVMESKDKTTVIMKACSDKLACKQFEALIGKDFPGQVPGVGTGVVIKEATCSKAPASFSSFFPAFLGLLLMKLLF